MKRIYYVRHGESVVNVSDIFSTTVGAANDKGLTKLGKKQAHAGGKKAAVEGFKPDLIISSPLRRAQETATILAKELGYPTDKIATSDLFVEMQIGELEGTGWNAFWEGGNSYANLGDFTGAETLEAMQLRAKRALEFLRSRPEETILVVSHSAYGRALKRAVNDKPFNDEFTEHESLPHGEISRLI